MKNLFKISLLIICILFPSIAVIHSTNGTDTLEANERDKIQPTMSVEAYTYVVFIFTGSDLYIDQFEFEAGDSFKVSSQQRGEWDGSWQESDLILLSFFQAQVPSPDITTTTTASSEKQTPIAPQSAELEETKFLINLSGISYETVIPSPFDINLSTILGIGLYLGHEDVFFIGFAGITEEPEFGSIDPDQLEQGEKNVSAEIVGKNTRFMEKNITIDFSKAGVDAKDIQVVSNTKLKFLIDVDPEAEIGLRNVSVDYEEDSIEGKDVFEVLKREETTTSTTSTP